MMTTKRVQKAALTAGLGYVGYKVLDSQINISTDLTFAMQFLPAARKFKYLENERPDYTVADNWDETCAQNRTKPCIINADNGEEFTFGKIDEASNRVAHWALANGLKQGDVVALFMENRPEFMITLIGLAKVGIVVAMINTANKQKPLIHSIGES
jgi:long-subunit acyl-CoA synthetase (AMP-forming)